MNPPRPSGCRTATLEGGPRGRCLLLHMQLQLYPKPSRELRRAPLLCMATTPLSTDPLRGGDWPAGRKETRRYRNPRIPGSLAPGPARRGVQLGTRPESRRSDPRPCRWGGHRPHRAVGEEKSWGGRHPKTGQERVGGGQGTWREERQAGDHDSGGGVSSRPGVPAPQPPARSQAQLRGFPGPEGFGSLAPINSHELVHPVSSAVAEAPDWAEGWGASCDNPSKGSSGVGRSSAPPRRRCGGSAPTIHSLRAPGYQIGFQMGGSARANLGRRGYRFPFAGKTTPSPPPAQPALALTALGKVSGYPGRLLAGGVQSPRPLGSGVGEGSLSGRSSATANFGCARPGTRG